MAKPETEHEWTIHSINIHGVFFERWCEQVIRATNDFKLVSTNYPVEFPPSKGLLGGKESSLDIRAELHDGNSLLTFIIECKKNNPDFINWVFFPKIEEVDQRGLALRSISNNIKEDLSQGWDSSLQLFRLPVRVKVFNEARETRSDYQAVKNGLKTKTSNAAITEAAYQVALATKAIWKEEHAYSERRAKYKPTSQPKYNYQVTVPCIVTTAKLYSCNFDPSDIDPERGEIPWDKANLQEEKFVIYEYPLPKHLQPKLADSDPDQDPSSDILELLTRMDIVVVNSLYFKELLAERKPLKKLWHLVKLSDNIF